MDRYPDCNGIFFDKYRLFLPTLAQDFPRANIVKDRQLLSAYRLEHDCCMVCGLRPYEKGRWLECHHIVHGANGRSDELTNLIMLCSAGPDSGCHSEAHGGYLTMGKILHRKWSVMPREIDWVRMAILMRKFLPDLDPKI